MPVDYEEKLCNCNFFHPCAICSIIPLDGKVDNTFLFFLGRFHPIILHLPIGALMVLLLMEIINKFRPKLNLDAACKILLWFSVLSIIPTITLGFLWLQVEVMMMSY